MPRILFLLALITLYLGVNDVATAQSVQALVDRTTIGVEETVTYTVEVLESDPNTISPLSPPTTTGLDLLSRFPSRSTNVSWVNGVVTTTTRFSWQFSPVETGQAYFEPLSVVVGGVTYTTEGISVEVVQQSQRPQPRRRSIFDPPPSPFDSQEPAEEITGEDIFIRATTDKSTAFINEQVMISYELLFRPGMQPRNSRQTDSWDAEGFWREDLNVESDVMPQTEVINGLRYNSVLIKRVAVFPTRSGELTVDPLRISTEVYQRPNRGFGFGSSFFNNYEQVEPASQEVAINVIPFPDSAPSDFRNGVGNYSMEVGLSQTSVLIGEPVELTITISGEGNISTLEGPQVELPGSFESYDPEVVVRKNDYNPLKVGGRKTFSYLMIPRVNGTFSIPPLRFTFLNPETGNYQSILRDLPSIRVVGTMPSTTPGGFMSSGLPVDDIAPPMNSSRWVRFPSIPLHRQWWLYVALVLPLAVLGSLALWRKHTTRLKTDIAWARGRRAHPVARKHLKQARKIYKSGDQRAFFVELERSVLGFIGNRMNIGELGHTRAQLDSVLEEAGVPENLRKELQSFLSLCDAARFTPETPDKSNLSDALQQAQALIAHLDRSLSGSK